MKAFLLAGGRGERLRPLTLTCPKCLVPINGTPLLAIWLDLCAREGVTDVLLNVSHHADLVQAYLASRQAGPRVQVVIEPVPIGSAGTVLANRRFVGDDESFWVFYADNLTDLSFGKMLATHLRHAGPLTMGLFTAPNPAAAGIVQMDPDHRIVEFEEKPHRPRGSLANAGIYLARAALFDELRDAPDGVFDFGLHVLPRLVGRIYGHIIDEFLADIGTPAALERASTAWSARRQAIS